MAVFSKPVVLLNSARKPVAVLSLPVVFLNSVAAPTAVLALELTALESAKAPKAQFAAPALIRGIALDPSAVLNTPPTRSGSGDACAVGENAKHPRATRMMKSVYCTNQRLIDLNEFMALGPLSLAN